MIDEMKHKSTVKLHSYNYDTKTEDDLGEVSIYHLARSMDAIQLAYLISEMLNMGRVRGSAIGKEATHDHRTLQGLLVNFCLEILVELGKQEYWDARNEMALATCRKVTELLDSGNIKRQFLI